MAKTLRNMRTKSRGFSVIAVMAILSVAVVMTYAMLKGQVMSVQISRNTNRAAAARQAAETGIAMAIRQMHQSAEWGGVATTYNQTLNATDSFSATYSAGDPDLTDTDDDWEMYPYRVTIDVEGRSADSMVANNIAVSNIRAVVQLVPRAVPAELTNWSDVLQYTLYQTEENEVLVELPCRIEGPVRLQEKLSVLPNSANDEDGRTQYLEDLNGAQLDGYADYRPFEGPVSLPIAEQDSDQLDDVAVKLGIPLIDTAAAAMPSDWTTQPLPSGFSTYQIYPGGPTYTIPSLSGSLSGSIDPDPTANPLGIHKQSGNTFIDNGASVRGTLIVHNNLTLRGTSIEISPVELLPLHGTTEPIRLPTILAKNLEVESGSTSAVFGLVALWDEFVVEEGTYDTTLDFNGHLITPKFFMEPRTEWTSSNWGLWHWIFGFSAPGYGSGQYFPLWLEGVNFYPQPKVTLKQDTEPATYHWKRPDPNETIYIPGSGDDGLFWDIVRVEVQP